MVDDVEGEADGVSLIVLDAVSSLDAVVVLVALGVAVLEASSVVDTLRLRSC